MIEFKENTYFKGDGSFAESTINACSLLVTLLYIMYFLSEGGLGYSKNFSL